MKSAVIIGIAIAYCSCHGGSSDTSGIINAVASEGNTPQVQINGPSGGWTYIINDAGHDITTYDSEPDHNL